EEVHLRDAEHGQEREAVPKRRGRTRAGAERPLRAAIAAPWVKTRCGSIGCHLYDPGSGRWVGSGRYAPLPNLPDLLTYATWLLAHALTVSRFLSVRPSAPASTVIASPSRKSPSSTRSASGSSTRRWVVRLSGRA